MSLVYKIALEERVGSFVIKDVTGNYTFDYPYGYGPLNVLPSYVTSCKAYIKSPVSTAESIVDLGNQFPGDGSEYQIMPWDIQADGIKSGRWYVTVEITGTYPTGHANAGKDFKFRATTSAVFVKEVECCIDKMVAKTYNTKFDDVFREEKSRKTAEMSVLLNRVKKAICCDDMVSADNIITYLRLNCRCAC
jgi:hypothetical protein